MSELEGMALSFGPFRLFPREKRLKRDGVAVQLGSRALDVLIALVKRAGEVVSNEALTAHVWPDSVVEESGLRVQIAALRRALGEAQADRRYVTNVPGRGYCFVAQVSRTRGPPGSTRPSKGQPDRSLPLPLAAMVGRDAEVRSISAALVRTRFVSIVGPGGMGKTTLAVAVCHALLEEFAHEVRFVDLVALSDPTLVSGSVASAIGVAQIAGDSISSLVELLRDRRMLLVIDNCEHVIETVAPLLETIFEGADRVCLLSTSREALRVEGEHVHRVAPLEYPAAGTLPTAAEAMTFSAVQLFVERARANGSQVVLSDADAPVVAEICRRLDGIALGIEFAAGRVEVFGIRGTAELLENRFKLQWRGRRTALPRHQTLSAMIDWSYSLLTDLERLVLRRLSVFVGSFSLEAASVVVADCMVDAQEVIETLGSLADKSLVSIDGRVTTTRYRLLDTTRAYAGAKLEGADESRSVQQRHAEYFCRVLDS